MILSSERGSVIENASRVRPSVEIWVPSPGPLGHPRHLNHTFFWAGKGVLLFLHPSCRSVPPSVYALSMCL
jgi:hypothetical protein